MKRAERRALARSQGIEFERLPGSRTPFKWAMLKARQIEVISGTPDTNRFEIQMELSRLIPYKSHGHGGKPRTKNRITGTHCDRNPGKYDPAREDRKHARMGR